MDCGVEIVYVLCDLGGCVVYDRWLVGLESVFVWSVMGGKYVICYFEENVKKYWEFFDVLGLVVGLDGNVLYGVVGLNYLMFVCGFV